MNAENKIDLKKISADDPKIPEVIKFSIELCSNLVYGKIN
jgi:hypothetical protein